MGLRADCWIGQYEGQRGPVRALGDLGESCFSWGGAEVDRVEGAMVRMGLNGRQGHENNWKRRPTQRKEQGLPGRPCTQALSTNPASPST